MNTNFVLVSILVTILIGGAFGLFPIDDVFAQNLYVSSDDSEAYEKQKELEQKQAEREAKQKELEQKKAEKAAKAEEKRKELEQKKAEKAAKDEEQQKELEAKAEDKQKELEAKAEEKRKELEQKKAEKAAKAEEKRKELEQKKAELEINRQNLEAKQLKKLKEYEEKLKEIKEKSQKKIEQNITNDPEKLSQSKQEEKLIKKSEDIQKKLIAKSDELDPRTKNILSKINNGTYMGEKITSLPYAETYELVFDSVSASMINNKSHTSLLTGKMNFTTYDKNKSNLKLELDECTVTVDEITYNCGFGKARTVSSGESGAKDSLVIVAFLESDVLEDVHTTLKIFLNADIPINKIEQSQVSILGPQSKISNSWFLDGTATLSKIISTSEKITTGTNSTIKNGIN